MKLFMFYVGGDCRNSNVELHDVRFSVGETPEDCHDDLRRQWWGDADSLHLDCWGAVEQADGFDVALTTDVTQQSPDKLFFVNLGGYDPAEFSELHRNVLLVAADPKAAKERALAGIATWALPHKDKVFEVEKAVDISRLILDRGYVLSLKPAVHERPFNFVCNYLPLA